MATISDDERARIETQGAMFLDPKTTYSVEVGFWAHFEDGRVEKVSGLGAMIGTYEMMRDTRDAVQKLGDELEVNMDARYGVKRVSPKRKPG